MLVQGPEVKKEKNLPTVLNENFEARQSLYPDLSQRNLSREFRDIKI
jgi:hypothetical protein